MNVGRRFVEWKGALTETGGKDGEGGVLRMPYMYT